MRNSLRPVRALMVVLFALLVATSMVSGENARAAEKVYRMKIQSLYPRGDLSMETLKIFSDAAAKYSDGRLKIKIFAEPEIVPGDQLFVATKQGVVDMLQGMGGMWGGMVPVGYVEFNLPLAFRISEASTFKEKARVIRDFYMNNGFMDILREEYAKQDMYLLDIHTYGPVPFVLSTKKMTTCEDLNGMKIKADGGNMAYHSGVGMQAVQISPSETYMALKLGTVDAAEWDVSAVTGMKWHEVAPYWVQGMECDHAIGHILVSMKKWDRLPDDVKAAMHKAAEDYWVATVDAYEKEIAAVEKLVEEGKVKVSVLDQECQDKYADVAHNMWDEMAQQDEASSKAISMIKKWRNVR
ncbi:TRAP transporter substrate-binding protein DctP [Desulforhopalus singaporensis]|uniref:TRAP-type mannitol/chloroaromatic compound transport system, substrate-binding protein n=1 Tax=Desulforhopalus singaporensis TaxID=91360 RepID=A0A1H0SKM0_9BACT|nr:TRAP transporter substrate-binding protein DctP [Desulforhopalus singaporensis]SDP42293.1 TRAP-type mannitol/chloroaromatic compound transport system, substrate-binding protein [Desulforhopalus singaporensis]